MHTSAMKRMEWFIQNYIPKNKHIRILDIGSYNVNGCYKPLLNGYNCEYVGLDLSPGPNVDVVLEYPYCWIEPELDPESFDFVISGNAFEHIEYPWETMKRVYDVLKPNGIACILAPFNLSEHRYPTDCYRYYPDGMKALAKWAELSVIQCTTGGVPNGVDLQKWIPSQNYDDTVLIATKSKDEEWIKTLPKFAKEIRFKQIFGAS